MPQDMLFATGIGNQNILLCKMFCFKEEKNKKKIRLERTLNLCSAHEGFKASDMQNLCH